MIQKTFIFLFAVLGFSFNSKAQFSLNETGFTIGGGPSLMSAAGSTKLLPGFSGGGFFSHYVCGKKYGFHGELEWRGMMGPAPSEWSTIEISAGKPTVAIHSIEPGFYFKLRPHTYHRPKEAGILIGPRAAFVIISKTSFDDSSTVVTNSNRFVPALHISGWIRRPFGSEDGSFFIRPGVNIYLSPILDFGGVLVNSPMYSYMNYYFFLEIGVRVWNDR